MLSKMVNYQLLYTLKKPIPLETLLRRLWKYSLLLNNYIINFNKLRQLLNNFNLHISSNPLKPRSCFLESISTHFIPVGHWKPNSGPSGEQYVSGIIKSVILVSLKIILLIRLKIDSSFFLLKSFKTYLGSVVFLTQCDINLPKNWTPNIAYKAIKNKKNIVTL